MTIGGHRQDIDGMRAVAVVLVILYHLERSFAPGGFVGVDIFFVISGFVVTRSSFAATTQGSAYSVAQFWRRRILRILPPLLLTVLVSLILIATLTAPFPEEAYKGNVRTGVFAVFGLGNLYLYRGSSNYFRDDALANSFVHTWSLGVEEQFYFVFAVLFIALMGLPRIRRVQLSLSLGAMSALGVISYCAFLWAARADPLLTYYTIPFRFWEIAAGGILAYVELKFPAVLRPRGKALTTSIQLLALVCLIKIIWFYGGQGFPMIQISVAVAASILLIAAGAGGGLISRVLSNPLFVAIGLLSYSIYLWHYPILLFWRTNFGLHSFSNIFLALLCIVAGATFSYWTVERTFRYSDASFSKVLLPTLITALIAVVGFALLIQSRPGIFYAGSKQLWNSEWWHPKDAAYFGTDRILFSTCDVAYGSAISSKLPDQCLSNSTPADPGPTVLLVGDSHAFADWGMAAFGASNGAYRFATLTHDNCQIGGGVTDWSESCRTYWANMPGLIANTIRRNDSVFIADYWPLKSSVETERGLTMVAAIAQIAEKQGAEVIVEAPLPTFKRPAYLCTKEWYRTNYDGCTVARSAVEQQRADFTAGIQRLMQNQSNIRVWDPLPILCPTNTCGQFRGDSPLFRDGYHLSYRGAQSLGPAFVSFWKHVGRTT